MVLSGALLVQIGTIIFLDKQLEEKEELPRLFHIAIPNTCKAAWPEYIILILTLQTWY